ncbi:hypothetical protein GH714_001398 [Hevea brasiliensis]|uniref:3-hydroxyisobutyryl-CoA hydrolase n=1 Tax=Hevea brasiliensis TaxID=3981 RepID=A0A6A6N0S1_HEVBR|nr:hypothetical protein GH714_001398 [Hevea brasiliensis]
MRRCRSKTQREADGEERMAMTVRGNPVEPCRVPDCANLWDLGLDSLNALSIEMVSRQLELFIAYEEDPNVKLLVLKGNGRAFCAGGDVSAAVRDILEGVKFFGKQFILNCVMATYAKPHGVHSIIYIYISYNFQMHSLIPLKASILNGIVMGGGGGASIHERFRVATENSVFATPETALGLFPDVGVSYFLSRLSRFFGNATYILDYP